MNKTLATIITPTFNEEATILPFLERTTATLKENYEILVIDDSSQDKTQEIVRAFRKTNKQVHLYTRTKDKGIASALSFGFTKARGDHLVWLDCNLKHPPEKIPELLQTLQHAAIAKASRYIPGGGDQTEFTRRTTAALINKMASLFLGSVHDYSSGFIAIRKDVLTMIPFPKEAHHGDYLLEFLYRAHKKGITIHEVPYIMEKRGASKSKAQLLDPYYYFLKILQVKRRVDRP